MRATRAYIASAGTAVILLGGAVTMLVLVSGFIAFGSWPGSTAATELDQVVLRELEEPRTKAVRVRADAVSVARRARARQQAAVSAPSVPARAPTTVAPPLTTQPRVPTGTATPAPQVQPTTPPSGPGSDDRLPKVDDVTQQVGTEVQGQVQNVQTQLGDVVEQVIRGTGETVGGLTEGVGSLLGGGG